MYGGHGGIIYDVLILTSCLAWGGPSIHLFDTLQFKNENIFLKDPNIDTIVLIDPGLVDRIRVGRGAAKAEDAQGTPTKCHMPPSILVCEEQRSRDRRAAPAPRVVSCLRTQVHGALA